MSVDIRTKHGSAAEESAKDLLQQLLARYDVAAWAFTKRVVIDEESIPHSHPTLTLSPPVILREPAGLLSMYLHEQIHWQLVAHRWKVLRATRALRRAFPAVPTRQDGGAKNKRSTYLHLLVNWLEVESLRRVAGDDAAERLLGATADGPVYGWVYRQVRDRGDEIGAIVRDVGLLGPLASGQT